VTGEVDHVGLIIDDVTDVAVNKSELESANQELERLSRTDRLTQLYNRGYWEESLTREFARVRRTKEPATLMMFDIDHFKKVNDTYGHPTGDAVIRDTAGMLRETVRTTDICGRYGGEEFAVILVNTRHADALTVAERLRARIEAGTVQHEGHAVRYTVSLGLAEHHEAMADHKAWLERVDHALYESKRNGRNRVTVAAA
jgi:diguanylate cyclase (GGDEF)-like protein